MRKYILKIMIVIVFVTVLFSSCNEYTDDLKEPSRDVVDETDDLRIETYYEPKYISSNYDGVLYKDTFYYFDKTAFKLKYQNIKNPSEEGLPLQSDILAENEDIPFKMPMFVRMFVDKDATKANNDQPVLIMFVQDYYYIKNSDYTIKEQGYKYRFFSYNTATGKYTVIKEIKEIVQDFGQYEDYYYFTTSEGDYGWNLYRMNKDGSNLIKMDNPDNKRYSIMTVHNDRVYYSENLSKVYSTDLNFDDKQYFCNIHFYSDPFIFDGSFIHSEKTESKKVDGIDVVSTDIVRRPLDDPDEKEVLLSNVYMGIYNNNKFYYYLCNPRVFASVDGGEMVEISPGIKVNSNGAELDPGTTVLYEYDFDTKQSREVYNLGDEPIYRMYIAFSDKYIMYTQTHMQKSLADKSKYQMVAQNRVTGEETVIPY